MNQRIIQTLRGCLTGLLCLLATNAIAAESIARITPQFGVAVDLDSIEADFVRSKLAAYAATCQQQQHLNTSDQVVRRALHIDGNDGAIWRVQQFGAADPGLAESRETYTVTRESAGVTTRYHSCATRHIGPVLALMDDVPEELQPAINILALEEPSSLQSAVHRRHDYLTSHGPNRMLGRMDANDISRLYLDFDVSMKYPLARRGMDQLFDAFSNWAGLDRERHYAQLYFAFSGRFSQYIASRKSSPVVSRRFNPELFARFWHNEDSYIDFGYAHESNGQQISTAEGFLQEAASYKAENQPGIFARDGISRGWDYYSFAWQERWYEFEGGDLLTRFSARHYLTDGLLQGAPEEYNFWEGDGESAIPVSLATLFDAKPRNEYDGIALGLQYLTGNTCETVCIQKIDLTQTTGAGSPFRHNTTSLELTTDFFGLPLHLWARSGYNSDLVDYYDYTNSWGLGFEFVSR